ncbi:MAG TPA: EthD family reductase [Sneathiellales bacterium]|nr:EthD family reductase [Sneathiellales bacterium]
MMKLTALLPRRPDMTRTQFFDYWHTTHAAIALEHQKALRFVKYVQTHIGYDELNDIMRSDRNCKPPFDGVAQLWWESYEDMAAGIESPEAQEAFRILQEDEFKFIDVPNMAIWMGDDHLMFGND